MRYGFVRVAAAIPSLRIADCEYNATQIIHQCQLAAEKGASVICFPEMSITGYTCQDLFQQSTLLDAAWQQLLRIAESTASLAIVVIVGLPVRYDNRLYNCAAIVSQGKVKGFVSKTYLPNYHEFYEQRWFSSSLTLDATAHIYVGHEAVPLSARLIFSPCPAQKWSFGVELCEDLWSVTPPSNQLFLQGADVVFNLSASNELAAKSTYRQQLILGQSARGIGGYVYASSGFGESTQDLVFWGSGFVAENGNMIAEDQSEKMKDRLVVGEIDIERLQSERRSNTSFAQAQTIALQQERYERVDCPVNPSLENTLQRIVNPLPFVPQEGDLQERCEEIIQMQAMALVQRLRHTHAQKVVLGISGGLDSTLALLVCVRAFDLLGLSRQGIIGVTMPGYGTTNRTYHNAVSLMREMEVTLREVNIRKACEQHFSDIGHDGVSLDVVFENVQARERTQLLMDIANMENGLVIGTGDLSELALGWATYNGDHMSMYAVNVSIPKTLIRHLVHWVAIQENNQQVAQLLLDIIDTPISPELIPANEQGEIAQKTESLVGPYELHDFFLYHVLRFGMSPEKIFFLAQHAFDGHDNRTPHYSSKVILRWLTIFYRRFFAQQFKRSCLPDGPKVGSCSLSPRGDWRMPSDASVDLWLNACERLKAEID